MATKKTEAQIEFKAVTSEFSSNIKNMNNDIKTLSNELKLNATQLKGNADDIDLLTQRQNLLQRELEASSQKVELTNNSLQEAERLLGKNSTEYKNLYNQLLNAKNQQQAIQNELNQTTNKIKEQSEAVEKTADEMDDFSEEIKETNKEQSRLAEGLKTGLIAGITGVITATGLGVGALVGFTNDMDKAVNSYIAQTGESVEASEEFEDVMMGIYKNNFGESLEDIANSMSIVKTNLKSLDDGELQKATENALLLRDTFEYDLAESTRAVEMLMYQFGLTSDEAFSMIVDGTQRGLNKNGDFLDSLNEYSVHYAQLGLGAEDMFASFVNGSSAGTFSVDKLGDAMKEFGIRVKDGSESSKLAFEYLGYDADKLFKTFNEGGEKASDMTKILIDELTGMPDGIEKTTAGVALFGSMWEDLGEEGIRALGSMYEGIEITTDSLEQLNQVKYDDLGSALSGIGRNIQTSVAEPIQDNLLPILNDFVNNFDFTKLTDGINGFFNGVSQTITFLQENQSTLETIAIIIGSMATAYGLVTTAVGIYNVVMPIYTAVTTGASLATTALGGAIAFLTSPITIAVAIIGGLIATGVLLWKNWDTIKEKAGELKDWVVEKFTALKDGAVNKFNELKTGAVNKFNELKDGAVQKATELKDGAVNKFNELKTGATNKFNELKTGATNKFNEIKTGAVNKFNEMKTGVVNKFNEMKNNAVNKFTEMKNNVNNTATNIKDGLVNKFGSAKDTVLGIFDKIKNGMKEKVEWAKDKVSSIIDGIKGLFNFNFQLPSIKAPHFSISPSGWKVGDLLDGVIPKLSVEWRKDGAIFTKPTLFKSTRGLQGVSEAGPEAILPISVLESYINNAFNNSALQSQMYNAEQTNRIIEALENLESMGIYIDSYKVGQATANANDNINGQRVNLKGRGVSLA